MVLGASEAKPICRLNLDVLFLIMEQLERRHEILTLMKTCRTLHDRGIPLLLGLLMPFDQWTPACGEVECFESLSQYLSKYPSRLRYIEEVKLDSLSWDRSPWKYRAAIRAFKLMFEKCPNLKNVNFASVESFRGFDQRRRMSRSILPNQHTLQHLRSLTISNVGADVSAMLRGLTAPLVHLSLTFDIDFEQFPDSGEYPTGISPKDPVPLLSNFTSTLEELELCWCRWEDSWDMNSVHGIRCPKVHTLKTSYDWVPITPTLIYVFPNLKRLDIFNESPVNNFRDVRMSNQEYLQQLVLMGVRDRKIYHWGTLEELTGDKGSLFALALTCKVDRLEVDSCMADDIPSLQHILVDAEPSRLRLGLQDPSTIFAIEMDNARMMFQYQRLSRLSLGLAFPRNLRDLEDPAQVRAIVSKVIDDTIEILSHTALKYLCLSITWGPPAAPIHAYTCFEGLTFESDSDDEAHVCNETCRERQRRALASVRPDIVRQYLEPIQDQIMDRILHNVPSLEYLSTSFGQKNGSKSIKSYKIPTSRRLMAMKLRLNFVKIWMGTCSKTYLMN